MGPLPNRLVHTLYLPPTTGTMRMPAVRMPGGLRSSTRCGEGGEDCRVAAAAAMGLPATAASEAALAARKLRRFIASLLLKTTVAMPSRFAQGVDLAAGEGWFGSGKLVPVPGPTRRNPANPARSGRKQR